MTGPIPMTDEIAAELALWVWREVGSMTKSWDEAMWLTERVEAGDYTCIESEGNVLTVTIGAADPERGPWTLITSSDPAEHYAAALAALEE